MHGLTYSLYHPQGKVPIVHCHQLPIKRIKFIHKSHLTIDWHWTWIRSWIITMYRTQCTQRWIMEQVYNAQCTQTWAGHNVIITEQKQSHNVLNTEHSRYVCIPECYHIGLHTTAQLSSAAMITCAWILNYQLYRLAKQQWVWTLLYSYWIINNLDHIELCKCLQYGHVIALYLQWYCAYCWVIILDDVV